MSSIYYNIEYRFTSSLEDNSEASYISSYEGNIIEVNLDTDEGTKIGTLKLDLLLLNRAIDNRFPLVEIFDSDTKFADIAKYIFDIEQADFSEEINAFYDNVYTSSDICMIRRIELVASHRGNGIGAQILNDIFNRFSSSCGLFVLEAYPLQFNQDSVSTYDSNAIEWAKKLDFDSLSPDFEKSFYKLKAFYQKAGFHHIEGFDEWMFVNPGILNKILNE